MPDGPVVSNNTPLVALWILGRLDLLRDLYGEVLIPQAVHDEFIATEQARRQTTLNRAAWIKVTSGSSGICSKHDASSSDETSLSRA